MKPKVSTPQEASKAAARISNAFRNVESCYSTSPKVKNNTPLKNGSENFLKAEELGSGGGNIGLHDKDTGIAENNGTADVLKAEGTPENKCSPHKEDVKIIPITGGQNAISDISSISNLKNPTPQEVIESTMNEDLDLKSDLHSFKKSNEKERSYSEDQVNCLTRQFSTMDITGTQEMVNGDSHSSQQNLSSENNVCAPQASSHHELLVRDQKEDSFINLLKPTLSPTTNGNTAGKRIPLSVKDSLCNIGGSIDISKGSTVSEGEKNSQLLFSEEHFDTEQLR